MKFAVCLRMIKMTIGAISSQMKKINISSLLEVVCSPSAVTVLHSSPLPLATSVLISTREIGFCCSNFMSVGYNNMLSFYAGCFCLMLFLRFILWQ